MSKGFWARTSLGQAVECPSAFSSERVKDALQTDDEWLFRQKVDRFIQQDFCLFPISCHHGRLWGKVDRILVAWVLDAPRLNLLPRQIVFPVPDIDLHDAVTNGFSGMKWPPSLIHFTRAVEPTDVSQDRAQTV